MNEAELLLEKLKNVPAEEPDEWEQNAINELISAQSSGEVDSWVTVSEIQQKTKNANGKIALRLPKELHKKAIVCADEQGVSLNQYLIYAISTIVAREVDERQAREELSHEYENTLSVQESKEIKHNTRNKKNLAVA